MTCILKFPLLPHSAEALLAYVIHICMHHIILIQAEATARFRILPLSMPIGRQVQLFIL